MEKYTHTPPSPRATPCGFTPRRLKITLTALAATSALCASAATKTWTNNATTNPPDSTQQWSTGSNWGGTAPVAGDTVNVYRSGNNPASVLLDSATPQFTGVVDVDFGSTLLIASGGNLRFNGGVFRIGGNAANDASASFVTVEAGGQITSTTPAATGANSALYVFNNSKLTTYGTISVANITIQRNSTIELKGGSLTTTNSTYGITTTNASMSQTGGTLNTGLLTVDPTSTYTISGGTIADNSGGTGKGLNFSSTTNSTSGGTFAVVGGAATITFGNYTNDVQTGKPNGATKRPTFSFTLDNSAQHISTINIGDPSQNSNVSTAQLRQNANLAVALQSGLLLSGTNTYTLITRGTNNTDTSGWFNQATVFGANSLWADATSIATTLQIKFNSAQAKGTLDVSGATPLTFTAATLGYITLANVDTTPGATLTLDLGLTGGTLANFTSSLTSAGIAWSTGSSDGHVNVTLDPGASGGAYFAWDLSSIDPAMGVSYIGLAAIPEPAAWALLLGAVGLAVAIRRRSGRC